MKTTTRRTPLPVAHEEVLEIITRHKHMGTVPYVSDTLTARPSNVRRKLEELVERGWAERSRQLRTSGRKRRWVVVYSTTPAGGRALRDNETF